MEELVMELVKTKLDQQAIYKESLAEQQKQNTLFLVELQRLHTAPPVPAGAGS